MQHAHRKHRRTLGNVGKGDHRPEVCAAEGVDQLRVDRVGHVVQAGHDQRRIHQAEDGGKEPLDVGVQPHIDNRCNRIADAPADRADDGVGDDDGRHKRAERHNDHADHFGAMLFEELFKKDKHKARQHRRDNLALVADHLHLDKAEIPNRDFLCRCHRETVEQLGRNQRQPQDDTQNLGCAHLFGDRPDNADRQHVENRLADQPEEAVHTVPEGRYIGQALGAAVKEVDFTDHIAEPQDQAAADQRGNQRGKDFTQRAHDALNQRLICLGRRLDSVLADALNAGKSGEFIVKVGHIVADDHLELPRLGERSLY